jgi:hypothetical protein
MLLFISLFSCFSCGGNYLLIQIDTELKDWYQFLCDLYTQAPKVQIFKQELKNLVSYIKCPYELKENLLKLSPFGSSMIGLQGNNYLILTFAKDNELLIYPGMGVLTVQRDKVKQKGITGVNIGEGQENQRQGLTNQTEKEEIQLMTTRFITKHAEDFKRGFAVGIQPQTIKPNELLLNIIGINNQIKAKNFKVAKEGINELIDTLLKQSGTYNVKLEDTSDGIHNHVYQDKLYENHVKTEIFKRTIKDTLNYLYENLFVIYFQQKSNVSFFDVGERRALYEDYVESDNMSVTTSLNNLISTSTKNQFIKHYFYYDHFTKEKGTIAENQAIKFCREAGKDNLGDIVFMENLKNKLSLKEAENYLKDSVGRDQNNITLQKHLENLQSLIRNEEAEKSLKNSLDKEQSNMILQKHLNIQPLRSEGGIDIKKKRHRKSTI